MSNYRPLTVITLLAMPFIAAVITCVFQAEQLGIDFWNINKLQNQIEKSQLKDQHIDQAMHYTKLRNQQRIHVISQLLADEITMYQASLQFLTINYSDIVNLESLRIIFPQGTDLDRACFQVYLFLSSFNTDKATMLRCEYVADHPTSPTYIKQ